MQRSKRALVLTVILALLTTLGVTSHAFAWNKYDALRRAELGDRSAQYRLACSYEQGIGVPKDLEQAVYWMERSAAQGHREAKQALSRVKFKLEIERSHQDCKKLLDELPDYGELARQLEAEIEEEEARLRQENSAESAMDAVPPTPEGLKQYFQTMIDKAKAGDMNEARAMLRDLRLPDPDDFYKKTFGEAVGARMAASWRAARGGFKPGDQAEVDALEELVKRSKDGIDTRVFTSPDDLNATGGQRRVLAAMKTPVPLYSVRMGGLHLWSFVYVDGNFRLAGKMYHDLD